MKKHLNTPTRWTLWLTSAAALALALGNAAGGCTQPPTSIIPGLGGGGAGGESGEGGGSGGGVAANKSKELFAALEGEIVDACGSCHDAGGVADTPFLAGPDRYQSMLSWPGIVVKDPTESKLLTYPISSNKQHSYKKIDSAALKSTLFPKVKAWLAEEAKGIVTTEAPDAGKYIAPFTPIIGFNAVYLDALGGDYTGMALTFNATEIGDKALGLDDLEVHPTGKLGVHLVHPLFVVYPKGKKASPDPVDSFSNVDQYFDAGEPDTLGPGTVVITNWAANAKLSVAFQSIAPFSSEIGDGGTEAGPEGGCKDVDAFNANAKPLLQQNCVTCHGGGNPGAKGAVDMSSLNADPAAACAQVKNRINPDDAAASQLFITTDPGGNAAHPYKFGGDGGKFNAFRTQVSQWITAEKP
ncbi:MAG: hypothetical protein ABI193_11625 [Minicystis sp.]